jgi:hypothetical protein
MQVKFQTYQQLVYIQVLGVSTHKKGNKIFTLIDFQIGDNILKLVANIKQELSPKPCKLIFPFLIKLPLYLPSEREKLHNSFLKCLIMLTNLLLLKYNSSPDTDSQLIININKLIQVHLVFSADDIIENKMLEIALNGSCDLLFQFIFVRL